MKKSGWKIILGVAVLVCVICLGRFGWVKYQDYKTEQARKATLKEIASTEFTGENEGKEPEKVPAGVKHGQKINFKKLIKMSQSLQDVFIQRKRIRRIFQIQTQYFMDII